MLFFLEQQLGNAILAEQADRCSQFGRFCCKKCLKSPVISIRSLHQSFSFQEGLKSRCCTFLHQIWQGTHEILACHSTVVLDRPFFPKHSTKPFHFFSMAASIKPVCFLITKQSHQKLVCSGRCKADKQYRATAPTDHSLIHSTSPRPDNRFTHSNCLQVHPTPLRGFLP